jgi:hypothetical protein
MLFSANDSFKKLKRKISLKFLKILVSPYYNLVFFLIKPLKDYPFKWYSYNAPLMKKYANLDHG